MPDKKKFKRSIIEEIFCLVGSVIFFSGAAIILYKVYFWLKYGCWIWKN